MQDPGAVGTQQGWDLQGPPTMSPNAGNPGGRVHAPSLGWMLGSWGPPGWGGPVLHPSTPPGLHPASAPGTLQGEARHTAIKNITSVLFGICYSARVTGYKYILQRASSPPSRGGLRGHAGPGGTGASRPPARAASASRTGSRRARDGGPTRTQEMSPAARPVPLLLLPHTQGARDRAGG